MIDQSPGIKPVFLIDNQKTLTKMVDPLTGEVNQELNQAHRLPKPFTEAEFDIASRLVAVMRSSSFIPRTPSRTYQNMMDGITWQVVAVENVFARLLTEEGDYAPGVDSRILLPYGGKPWDELSSSVYNFPRRSEVMQEKQLEGRGDDITGWKICPEGRELLRFIDEKLECPQFVLSGIFSEQIPQMDESFREQDVDKYLTGNKYLLRSRAIRSSHLHKGLLHQLFNLLGVATIAVDEDPNSIDFISQWVGVSGCLVSTPAQTIEYTTGAVRMDLITNPKNGPIYQIGVDGGSYIKIVSLAYNKWMGLDDKKLFLPQTNSDLTLIIP